LAFGAIRFSAFRLDAGDVGPAKAGSALSALSFAKPKA
jgi:hypothetical protein